MNIIYELKNKKIAVLGVGLTGSAFIDYLLYNKIYNFECFDEFEIKKEIKEKLDKFNIKYNKIDLNKDSLLDFDLIFISPGIDRRKKAIKEAIERNIEIVNDIELVYRAGYRNIIAITGSNGKTTTTTLIGEIFRKKYNTFVGGNIGNAAINVLFSPKKYEIIILEISSFQLESITKFKPNVALILNITEDHLDRYNSFDDYIETKINIAKNQDNNDFLIVNKDDINIINNISFIKSKILTFSSQTEYANIYYKDSIIYYNNLPYIHINDIKLKGIHNIENIMAAILTAKIYNIEDQIIKNTIINFKPLSHRMQLVKEIKGIKFFNDSKATNPDSVKRALETFNDKSVIWIAGGRGKDTNYNILKSIVKEKVRVAIFLGEEKERLYEEFKCDIPCYTVENLEEAIKKSLLFAQHGDNIILSPACTSFDQYKSYKERGEHFEKLVNNIREEDI